MRKERGEEVYSMNIYCLKVTCITRSALTVFCTSAALQSILDGVDCHLKIVQAILFHK